MAYSRTMMVGFILMATASLASAATLEVGDAAAQVGGTAQVAVSLDNPEDDVRALQFSLGALPAGVEFVGAEASGRAAGLSADAQQQPDGTVRVVLISLGAETVAAGTGPVLDLHFALHGTGRFALMPAEVRVAGTAGALDATGQGGQLNIEGESAAPASGGGCAVGPTRSGQTLWLSLIFTVAWLVVRSTRRAASHTAGLWAILILIAPFCVLTPFHAHPVHAGWVQLDGDGVPRVAMACAYDSARGRGVSFGGDDPSWVEHNDTYEWNGATWALAASQGPSSRMQAGMVFNASRGKSVLFGGWVHPDNYYGDTWEWDGAHWQQLSAPGPSARAKLCMDASAKWQSYLIY